MKTHRGQHQAEDAESIAALAQDALFNELVNDLLLFLALALPQLVQELAQRLERELRGRDAL
jgi:hypothetical protein